MGEFDLIKTYFAPLAGPEGLGLLDDAALFTPKPGYDLVITKDTMVEGVHFPLESAAHPIAQRLMRVNLSDLAAKGAKPKGYLLSIAWPKNLTQNEIDKKARAFAEGLKSDQEEFGFHLYGGDTVSIDGPMVVSATFIGQVPTGKMVKRSGARPGDDVWVTGTIGDSYLGLKCIQNIDFLPTELAPYRQYWLDRYWKPEPRLALSEILRKYATACADISDGIIADFGNISAASGLGIVVEFEKIPFSAETQTWLTGQTEAERLALVAFGDDYELAFTADAADRDRIRQASNAAGLTVTLIGKCQAGSGVTCIDTAGNRMSIAQAGFKHF